MKKSLIDKVLEFKDLINKHNTEGLDSIEEELYNNLFNYLKYEKFKDIEEYRLDFITNTSTEIETSISPIIEEEIKDEILTDIFEEMVQTLKQIHQKFINEGELEVDDVLLFDSLFFQLKKEGYYVDKYKIR